MKKLFTLLVFLPLFSSAQIITTFAGNNAATYAGDGGSATMALLSLPSGVAIDAAGNKYIADKGNNRIRMISAAGVITTIAGDGTASFSGDGGSAAAAEINAPTGVAVDAAGNIYIADCGNQCVRKINTSGIISTIAGTSGSGGYFGDGGPATAAHLFGPTEIAIDAAGNLYIADAHNHCIRKVNTSGIITRYAGAAIGGYSGDGGPATIAMLNSPTGVFADASGNIFIADELNSRIRKVSAAGIITTIAGSGIPGFSGDLGAATAAGLYQPAGVTADAAGNVYFTDMLNHRIRKINTSGVISTVGGNGTNGFTGDGGPATAAGMYCPFGLAIDATGNLLVADVNNNRIRQVSASGIISTIAGSGMAGFGDNGLVSAAQLLQPGEVQFDPFGNIYILDEGHNFVRKVNSAGIVTTIAGNSIRGYNGDGIPATSASFDVLSGMVIDNSGNLYVCDQSNYRVRKISTSGIVTTIGGNGLPGHTGDNGPATAAECQPNAITIDLAGNLYFSDFALYIRKIDTSGIITTIAGNGTLGYGGDGGPATAAELYEPQGLNVDASGNIYISDEDNDRIRKISASGIISTIAGDGTFGFSGDGGPATDAVFHSPCSVSLDNAGNMFICDLYNNIVRKIDTAGIITTIAGDETMGYAGDGGPATAAECYYPVSARSDNHGHLYIADFNNNVVRVVDGMPAIPSYVAHIEGADTVCLGSAISLSDSTSYGAWSTSGSVATVGTDGTVTGTAAGTAVITYTDGGTYTTTTVNVVSCTNGLQLIAAPAGITIYPNPATTQLTISATGSMISQIVVTNVLGQTVFTGRFNAGKVQVDVSNLPGGVYAVRVSGSDSSAGLRATVKFVKE